MRKAMHHVPSVDVLEARALLSVMVAESEGNNRTRQADVLVFDADNAATLTGVSKGASDRDYFAFTSPISGTINASVSARNGVFADLEIEDAAGRHILETHPNNGRNTASGILKEGARYFVRLRSRGSLAASYSVDLLLGGVPSGPSGPGGTPDSVVKESRSDDRPSGANPVDLAPDQVVRLQGVVTKRDRDFYKITPSASGTVSIETRTTNGILAKVEVETAAGANVFETEPKDGRTSGTFAVSAGQTYFILVRSSINASSAYQVDLLVPSSNSGGGGGGTGGTTGGSGGSGSGGGTGGGSGGTGGTFAEVEANDDKTSANAITLGLGGTATLTGTSASQSDRDFFRFTPSAAGRLTVTIAASAGALPELEIEDSSGLNILEIEPKDGATTGSANLIAGTTYFVRLRAQKDTSSTYRVDLTLA